MSELLLLGTSHKTAPLAVRERIALPERRAEQFLAELKEHPEIREAVVVSTCNRTELYVVVSDPVEAETTVLGMFARQAGLRPTELIEAISTHTNCDAARHLYRVTSGLESMIVGEAEVQGQVKRAYEAALAARTTGPLTNKLFRAALATGKRVRTETSIGAGGASVASVAVEAARNALGGGLASRHVLIIGAGETAELTARALSEQGVATMFVANRRRERAIALAQRFGGDTIALDGMPAELERADIVVSSTASPHYLVHAEELAQVMTVRAGPAAAAARPGRAARHRARLRDDRRRDARRHRRPAGPGRAHPPGAQDGGAPRRGHRRGGDPDVRRLARDARGDADDRRAARAGRPARRGAARRRTRRAGSRSPTATASGSRRCCGPR